MKSRSKFSTISTVAQIKNLLRWSLLIALLASATAFSQGKTAFVASEAIMEKLGDAKTARTKLSEVQLGWMRDIERQETEITKLRTDIQANRLLWSTQEKRDAESKLADLDSKLNAFRLGKFGPSGEFERQQSEIMGPVVDKISKAIEEEARAQKYDFVWDKSSRGASMLYANPANDITWDVLKRLGVEVADSIARIAVPTEGSSSTEDAMRNRGRRDRGTEPSADPEAVDPNKALKPVETPVSPPER